MTSTKNTIIKATKWSAIEKLSVQFVQFFISIIIARLLAPSDYGIIGMIAILLGISQSFIDSGFSQALIHKTNRDEKDCNTVFLFNILIGIICYAVIYIISPYVAEFYNMPILTNVTRVIALSIPIRSLTIVQIAILTARTDFKSQSSAAIPAAIISGIFGIYIAYRGGGVWALVWQELSYLIIHTIIIWIITKWKPKILFSIESFKDLFSYGSKLLFSGLIDTIYNNSFALIIGKFYNAADLGKYTKAKTFPYFISVNLSSILQRAIFPILCQYQEDNDRLILIYQKYLRTCITVTTPLILGLCALASPIINLLLSEKWMSIVPYLQILCFFYILSPITMLNNNIYQAKGATDVFLKLEIIKKVIGFTCLCVSIPFGLKAVCISSVIGNIISLTINMSMTFKIIPLKFMEQIKNIIPVFVIGSIMAIITYCVTLLFDSSIYQLIFGIVIGVIVYSTLNWIFNKETMQDIIHYIIKRKK